MVLVKHIRHCLSLPSRGKIACFWFLPTSWGLVRGPPRSLLTAGVPYRAQLAGRLVQGPPRSLLAVHRGRAELTVSGLWVFLLWLFSVFIHVTSSTERNLFTSVLNHKSI
jgi:hypothetical protein